MSPAIGLCVQLACTWEATARKPGNVHRFRDFADLHYVDLLMSGAAIASILERAPRRKVGDTVLDAVRATRQVVRTNANLGIVLLLAPLAAAETVDRVGVEAVLESLDVADACDVFAAIRLADPGGMGEVPEQDVKTEPTLPLRPIMSLAAERDLVARQYANGYREVFDWGVPVLQSGLERFGNLEQAIVLTHLRWLAEYPDSLIARKRGHEEASEASRRAAAVLAAGWPANAEATRRLTDLDDWLRADGHQRNPGTSADLVAACLFVALRRGIIPLPCPWEFSPSVHHG